MVDILLLLLLIVGFLIGLKRGFILQLFHLIGFIAAFIAAALYYDDLGPKLSLWIPYPDLNENGKWAAFLQDLPLESGFYNAIAFLLIFIAVKIVLQIIASMLDFVASFPILNSVNKLLGAILGFVEIYLILFILLYIVALIPVAQIQTWINDSAVALFIIEHTPYFSGEIKELWFTHVADK
ncbi:MULTISPECIES: CvpA family protein [Clostridia]|uniref:CvpA family protein n=1 Tax=Clostridia TaxID=186801 RepID=UPI000EA1ADB5|nr:MULTISPECIES: CvpA family protein [Clostridia]NBJ68953.1 CvpA family protein [Roseburia sp. 1XD42-34]RKI79857.1 CvpA family protein [Clostridium sp. 1xD42-85]